MSKVVELLLPILNTQKKTFHDMLYVQINEQASHFQQFIKCSSGFTPLNICNIAKLFKIR